MKVKKRFVNTYKFSNHYINKFILLLRKVVYPYEYMDYWEKFNKTSCNVHAKIVCKDFKIKNLGEYQDLYVPSDA